MGNTQENLQEAFAGESQANRKYLFYSEKAEAEGYHQIARLFRATAEAETVHARRHLQALDGIQATEQNLEDAINGESYEFTEMYPAFIEKAREEGNKKAELTLTQANAVEKIHHGLYQKALNALKAGGDLKEEPYYICPVCGYTAEGKAPDKCPVCGAPASKFKKVE